jgi:hypothetical protein
MDRVTAMVAIAHLRLRLDILQRHPEMLGEDMALKIKQPIELAGLKSHLIRAEGQEKTIAVLAKRYGKTLDAIDELTGAHAEHVGALEHYEADLRRKIEGMVGSNGGDPLDGEGETGQDGQSSEARGQVISSETKV